MKSQDRMNGAREWGKRVRERRERERDGHRTPHRGC